MSNIQVRPFHPDDVPALYKIATNPAVSAGLLRMPTMNMEQAETWLSRPKYHLTAELDGEIAGSVRLSINQHPRMAHAAGIGIMVRQNFWGKGVGTTLISAILDLAHNWLNLGRVELTVWIDNKRAIRLYEKFGFETEATMPLYSFGDGGYQTAQHMTRLSPELQKMPTRPSATFNFEQIPIANPAKLLIRAPVPSDAEQMHELFSHPAVARTTLQLPSMQIGEITERMAKSDPLYHRFVAEYAGIVVGSASLVLPFQLRRRHVGGVGMGVHPNYWGQGVGSALMAKVNYYRLKDR